MKIDNYLQPLTAAEINERRERLERKIARAKKEHRVDMIFLTAPFVFLVALAVFSAI